ncbi:MAG: carboxypeptidase regulatory-like domain-containing protein [Acidobacteriota bacterium]|nr:carboxypeptidase regulatory-like domain-containing protein [Acidobacteriota bacterium]
MFRPSRLLAALFLSVVLLRSLHSQVAGELKGRLTDIAGASIPSATVRATESATHISETSTSTGDGYFVFAHLVPGTYQLEIDAAGFHHTTRTGITLMVGQTVAVEIALRAGEQKQSITVSADAPLLQSQTSSIQTTIPASTIRSIPLNTRNFVQLTTLVPGVELPPGTLLPRINGGRPRTNEYLFDGISALQPEPGQVAFFPILDDIQDFTVETDNVSAEFGRFNGGVINVATRYGTNQLHGSLFEYFRNEALNARNYFSKAPARQPEYRRNLFGATLGGPILHDRLFFFSDFQGVKQRIGVTRISTIPTLAMRRGVFTGLSNIYDPSTTTVVKGKYVRHQFGNNVIDRPFDPAAAALLLRLPAPTDLNAIANNYTRTANDDDHQNQFDLRIDGAIGSHDRAFARYSYYSEVEQPVTPLPEGSGAITGSVLGSGNVAGLSNILGQQVVLNETHSFTSSIVNDLRLGYTRRGNTIDGAALGDTASAALGIPGIPANAAFNNALPLFTFTGLQQLGSSPSTFSQYQTAVWQLTDTVLFTRGQHALKAGGDLRWYQLNAIAPPDPTGSFAFTTTGTNQQGVANSGNSFASFLLGQVDTFQIDLQRGKLRPRDHIEEYFVQDDWRVLPQLTLNIGARWTLHLPSTERSNQGAVFNLQTQQLDYLGQNGNSRSARQLHWGNVAPRIGFAWLLTPQTVLRSGFGIVFIDQSGITTPFTTPQFPFIQGVQQKTQDSVNGAFTLSSGPTVSPIPLTPDAGLGQSVYTVNRTAGSGYVQQWNLAIQHSITGNLSFDLAYVGSHIVHVGIPDSNLNQLTADQLASGLAHPTALTQQVANPFYGKVPASSPLGAKTVAAAQLLKPYPRFQNVATYRNNSGTTNYNAFEAKLEQRFSRGLAVTFAYTHSRLIDDASSVFSSTVLSSPNSNSLVAADTFRPYLERDVSQGDMSNVTAASVVYDLPAGRNHRFATNGISRALLGDWTGNAILSLQSGMPVTVTQATNNNAFAGFALQRPNIVANPTLPASQRTPAKYFNTAAFTPAPQFTLGNASRNPVRGPAYRDLDLSFVKHARVGERTVVEFRAELFNLTNTPAFSQPNGSFGTAAFGSITSTTTDPRVAQLAIRISR